MSMAPKKPAPPVISTDTLSKIVCMLDSRSDYTLVSLRALMELGIVLDRERGAVYSYVCVPWRARASPGPCVL